MANEVRTLGTVPPRPGTGTDVDLSPAQHDGRDWLERHQTLILSVVGALVLVGIGVFLYREFIVKPQQAEASEYMWQAQQLFAQDSFEVALLGRPDGSVLGFETIAEDYGGTPAGNLAEYYAGISYLHLGQYDAAIDALESFDEDGSLLPATKAGALGDAYAQKDDLASARGHYDTALSEAGDNSLLAPYYLKKLALLDEREGNVAQANERYRRIKSEFPTSNEASDIDKFVLRTDS